MAANPVQDSSTRQLLERMVASRQLSPLDAGVLAKYKAVQKAKQAKLEAAQADLKKVLTTKQEAQAYLLSLVN